MPKKMDLKTRAIWYAAVRINSAERKGSVSGQEKNKLLGAIVEEVITPGKFEPQPTVDKATVMKWLTKPSSTKAQRKFEDALAREFKTEELHQESLLLLRNSMLERMLLYWSPDPYVLLRTCVETPGRYTDDTPFVYFPSANYAFWVQGWLFSDYLGGTPLGSPSFFLLGAGQTAMLTVYPVE